MEVIKQLCMYGLLYTPIHQNRQGILNAEACQTYYRYLRKVSNRNQMPVIDHKSRYFTAVYPLGVYIHSWMIHDSIIIYRVHVYAGIWGGNCSTILVIWCGSRLPIYGPVNTCLIVGQWRHMATEIWVNIGSSSDSVYMKITALSALGSKELYIACSVNACNSSRLSRDLFFAGSCIIWKAICLVMWFAFTLLG